MLRFRDIDRDPHGGLRSYAESLHRSLSPLEMCQIHLRSKRGQRPRFKRTMARNSPAENCSSGAQTPASSCISSNPASRTRMPSLRASTDVFETSFSTSIHFRRSSTPICDRGLALRLQPAPAAHDARRNDSGRVPQIVSQSRLTISSGPVNGAASKCPRRPPPWQPRCRGQDDRPRWFQLKPPPRRRL